MGTEGSNPSLSAISEQNCARGGKLAYLQATGFEGHDKNTPMRPDSIFRIGSMSKQITSVATMMLVDESKLDRDAPVAQYLPELRDMQVVKKDPATGDPILLDLAQKVFEPAKRAMTIRDLLRNTSGLVYGTNRDTVRYEVRRRRSLPCQAVPETLAALRGLPAGASNGGKARDRPRET